MTVETARRYRRIPALTGSAPELDLTALPIDPVELFEQWLAQALHRQVPEPLAMTLATVDPEGLPDARTLLLKDLDDRGWAFAGPTHSDKGLQLAARPVAALNFWWQPIVRAVRVRGRVVEATREESSADLAARGASARARLSDGDWTLWRVVPQRIEFWQGARDRNHRRMVYTRTSDGWSVGGAS